jgi:uncharacterized membrane protein
MTSETLHHLATAQLALLRAVFGWLLLVSAWVLPFLWAFQYMLGTVPPPNREVFSNIGT